jgi:hypothetical protein
MRLSAEEKRRSSEVSSVLCFEESERREERKRSPAAVLSLRTPLEERKPSYRNSGKKQMKMLDRNDR